MIPRQELQPGYTVSRIIKGGWHLAGGHGPVDRQRAIRDMADFVDVGITTFDCADVYTGVEQLIGEFLRTDAVRGARTQLHTKFVPDLGDLASVDRRYIESIVDRSLKRLGRDEIDLLQFHWWDYAVPRYVEAALELERLRKAGKIRYLGVTNFSVSRLRELIGAGVSVISNQVQYSVIDRRPERGMIDLCREHNIGLLCYGTLAGGFISERWLGVAEPAEPLPNRSLAKYKLIIDEFGGWEAFQMLLRALGGVARKHGVGIGAVAVRTMLDLPQVAAAIVGATSTVHLVDHLAAVALRLDGEDRASIDGMLQTARGPSGDVYELERDRDGPHGRIMKYELNKE